MTHSTSASPPATGASRPAQTSGGRSATSSPSTGSTSSPRPAPSPPCSGPNGAGKTTFVRAVATLLRPDGGQLHGRRHRRRRPTRSRSAGRSAWPARRGGRAGADRPREPRHGGPPVRPRSAGSARGPRTAVLEQIGLTRRRATAWCARTRAACAGGSTSAPAWSARRGCCSSTSRRPVSTHAAASSCGRRSGRWCADGHRRAADHPVPRGGRPAGRPRRDHRPRPGHRHRDAGRAEGPGRSGRRRDPRPATPTTSPARRRLLAPLGTEPPRVDEPARRVAVRRRRRHRAAGRRRAGARRRRHRHRRHRPAPPDPRRGVPRPHRPLDAPTPTRATDTTPPADRRPERSHRHDHHDDSAPTTSTAVDFTAAVARPADGTAGMVAHGDRRSPGARCASSGARRSCSSSAR